MKQILFAIVALVALSNCQNKPEQKGVLQIQFQYTYDGLPLEFDTMKYVNAAGNQIEVTEIQWFGSDFMLKSGQNSIDADTALFARYIDTNIPASAKQYFSGIPAGQYDGISFTFGIKGAKNIPFTFTDPPESNMMWPSTLGGKNGGYHYMKMNGFWIGKEAIRNPFNFHLGVGPRYDEEGKLAEYVQNWFENTYNASFKIDGNDTTTLICVMQVENWFQSPHLYDIDSIGSKIMKNQAAMRLACDNGKQDVFDVQPLVSEP